jgi:hypothetical protein
MRDPVEDALAERLGSIAATVADELPPPVDLELRVRRRRGRARAMRRAAVSSVAAAVLAGVATVAVVRGASNRDGVRVATSSPATTVAPAYDALQPGTVLLSARGHDVLSLDAHGHQNATMVTAAHDIGYARATADHRHIWYLALEKGPDACGTVVRADLIGGKSTIVTHAVAFDVSPDGTRLALYGAGDLAHDRCRPVDDAHDGSITVVDLPTSRSTAVAARSVSGLRWSPDGSSLLATGECTASSCSGLRRIVVPPGLDQRLSITPTPEAGYGAPDVVGTASTVAFGPTGLFGVTRQTGPGARVRTRIDVLDPSTLAARTSSPVVALDDRWSVGQLLPTADALYVVATRETGGEKTTGLYREASGRLVLVRSLSNPGVFSPVFPIAH